MGTNRLKGSHTASPADNIYHCLHIHHHYHRPPAAYQNTFPPHAHGSSHVPTAAQLQLPAPITSKATTQRLPLPWQQQRPCSFRRHTPSSETCRLRSSKSPRARPQPSRKSITQPHKPITTPQLLRQGSSVPNVPRVVQLPLVRSLLLVSNGGMLDVLLPSQSQSLRKLMWKRRWRSW